MQITPISAGTRAAFNPQSAGLFGPLNATGFCLGPERLDADIQVWCDFNAAIYSGDTVFVFTVRPDHSIHALGKKIERTRDGKLWIWAYATREPDSQFAFPVDSEMLRILAIAPMVAELETPRTTSREPTSDAAGRECLAALGWVGGAAVREWREQGYMPRIRLPIENDPRSVALLREKFSDR
jgi:hypothetical protein